MGTDEGSAVDAVVDARMLAGRYRLGDRLGRGGMGTVWRARDEMLDREVAVKELSVGHLAEEDLFIVQSRMRQEARAAARIKHPGVVTIHDVLEQDGKPWIVMELIDGRSLAELVEQDGTLSPREAAGVGAQVLAALHRGHQVGVIHRDVKPANVLIERATGRVVLTDFGIATYEGDSALTRTGDLIGSPDYLAPERVHGHRPGPESDLWGLGATLFAAVEGQSPFRRDSPLTTLAAVVTDPLPEPKRAGALAPVLRALMAKDASERPDAPTAIRMLEDVAAGHTTALAAAAVPAQLREPTAAVPLPDRHTGPTMAAHRATEAIRPNFVEAEYRTGDQQAATAQTVQRPEQRPEQHRRPAPRQRQRRTWPWLVVVGLLAALGGGGAAYEVSVRHSTDLHRLGLGGSPAPRPSESAVEKPSVQFTAIVPPGYTLTTDPSGAFSFPLPPSANGKPWRRLPGATNVRIEYSPDDGVHQVVFAFNRNQPQTVRQHAEEMEGSLTKKLSANNYQQVHMVDDFRFRGGLESLEWESTYTDKQKQPRYTFEEMFKSKDGTEFCILVDYPQADRSTAAQRFQDIVSGFTGIG